MHPSGQQRRSPKDAAWLGLCSPESSFRPRACVTNDGRTRPITPWGCSIKTQRPRPTPTMAGEHEGFMGMPARLQGDLHPPETRPDARGAAHAFRGTVVGWGSSSREVSY